MLDESIDFDVLLINLLEEIQAALDASGMDGETKAKMVAAYSSGGKTEIFSNKSFHRFSKL